MTMDAAALPPGAWACPACGQVNLAGLTCESCGVARRAHEDPALDIPYRPRLTRLPSFWLALVWGLAALGGIALWLSPVARSAAGNFFLIGEIAASGAAAFSSLFTALWQRVFNEVEVVVPPHVKSGEELNVEVRLVPYETTSMVSVSVRLVDRFYVKVDDRVETAKRELGSSELLGRGTLRGRRLTSLSTRFIAPFPATTHQSFQAEMMADLLGLLAYVVPALAWQARNLREHGGYYVEAVVSVGLLTRRYHKRVLSYMIGDRLYVG